MKKYIILLVIFLAIKMSGQVVNQYSSYNFLGSSWLQINSLSNDDPLRYLTTDVNGKLILSSGSINNGNNSWSLTGNSGTNPDINFLGTKDDKRLVFKTNDMEKMTILSNGNVGIGVNNPLSRFHVRVPISTSNTTSDFANAYGVSITDDISSTLVIRSLGGGVMQLSSDFPGRKLVLGGGNFEQTLAVVAGGNVGIGALNPANKLEITHGTTGYSGLRLTNLTSATNTSISSTKVLSVDSNGDVILVNPSANIPATTNSLTSTDNTLTSTVNGIRATANAVNSVQTSLSGNQLTTSVNGVSSSVTLSGLTSNNWSLTGNLGTDPNINFLGTTDAQPLIFKTSGKERMQISANGFYGFNTPANEYVANYIINSTLPSYYSHTVFKSKDMGNILHITNGGFYGFNAVPDTNIANYIINSTLPSYYSHTVFKSKDMGNILHIVNDGRIGINCIPNNVDMSHKIQLNSGFPNKSGLMFTQLNSNSPSVSGAKTLGITSTGEVVVRDDMVSAITTNTLVLNGQTLTSTVNGVPSTTNLSSLTPTITNQISLSGNTLTSTVNNVSSTSPTVSSVTNTLSGSQLTTSVNGVASNPVDLSSISQASGDKDWLLRGGGLPTNNTETIYHNGIVGIGEFTTDLSAGIYNLYVKRGIRAEKVKVDISANNGWADYVFDKDYKLMTLSEVEQFISLNKRLPNIPAAQDMVKEGMDVAEMTNKLLEKVEELTLYTIEQDKLIKEQSETLKSYQSELEVLKQMVQELKNK